MEMKSAADDYQKESVIVTYNHKPRIPEERGTDSFLKPQRQFFDQKHQQERTFYT